MLAMLCQETVYNKYSIKFDFCGRKFREQVSLRFLQRVQGNRKGLPLDLVPNKLARGE